MTLSSPHELMAQISADARALDAGGRKLAQSIKRLADFEREYERAVQEALITIYHNAKEKGERLPAEDIRIALAHKNVTPEVYGAFLSAKAEAEALKAWTKTTASVLSARQTLLNVLRDELKAGQ